jgi:putative SOS response-associated peptidase YedK
MCAMYQISVPLELLATRFKVKLPNQFFPLKFTALPGTVSPVITGEANQQFSFLQWGLVPHWSDDPKIGHKLFNARSETISQKPSFAKSFVSRRCLVPADSFFEWSSGDNKIPMKFSLNDDQPFAMAGIYDHWEKEGKVLDTYTVLTTSPNETVGLIHDRMPVILKPEDEKLWLVGSIEDIQKHGLFTPYPDNLMKFEAQKV